MGSVLPVGGVVGPDDLTVRRRAHEPVLAQVSAVGLGVDPADIKVMLEMDTAKDAWSIAAGTYSCRFSPGTAVGAHLAAMRMPDKLAGIAANQLNIFPDDNEIAYRPVRRRLQPDKAGPFRRLRRPAPSSPPKLPG